LRSLETLLRRQAGEEFHYLDEVAALYDVRPVSLPDDRLEAAVRDVATALPGPGNLRERMTARRTRYELDGQASLPYLRSALAECRRRTLALYSLPGDEAIALQLTKDQPWGAYNWYRGRYQSLVEFNTDLPIFLPGVLDVMAHEGYPGHHTDGVMKERRGIREGRRAELACFLVLSPMAVIAEGIAMTARERIFPNDSDIAWTNDRLLKEAGMPLEPIEQTLALRQATRVLRHVTGNAAILLHGEGWPDEDVLDYLQTYGLSSRERALKRLAGLKHPLWRTYFFTYTIGYDLIARAAAGDKAAFFDRLLGQAVLPSTLAATVTSS
jgi:hypothetical protein